MQNLQNYIIDGNNLIGKIPSLFKLQKKDKQASREKLVVILDRYFTGKKVKVHLFYDGFVNVAIYSSKCKIYYSDKKTADDCIKNFIAELPNKRVINLVTSDHNLQEFGKVCSVAIVSSENFYSMISKNKKDSEEEKIKSINNDEIKKLFGY